MIPIMIKSGNGYKQLGMDSGQRPVLSRVYDKWSNIYALSKVYHYRGQNRITGKRPCILVVTREKEQICL